MSKRRGFQHPKVQLSPVHHGHHQIAVRRGRGLWSCRTPTEARGISAKGWLRFFEGASASPTRAASISMASTGAQTEEHRLLSGRPISAPDRARLPSPESTGLLSRGLWGALGLEKAATAVGSFMTAVGSFMTAVAAFMTGVGALPTSIAAPPTSVGAAPTVSGEPGTWGGALRVTAGAAPTAFGAFPVPDGGPTVAAGRPPNAISERPISVGSSPAPSAAYRPRSGALPVSLAAPSTPACRVSRCRGLSRPL